MKLTDQVKSFIRGQGIDLNKDSLDKLLRSFLKGLVYLVFLLLFLIVKYIEKASRHFVSMSYGILKPCSRCVYGKSRETLVIVSASGYSRDDQVLVVMNYHNHNWYRVGECLGYSKCGKCLDKINNKDIQLPCKWRRML